jgi:hypothetical protein
MGRGIYIKFIPITLLTIPSWFGFSQTTDPLSFFPHHLGDVWEYLGTQVPNTYWQYRITADSSGEGRAYIGIRRGESTFRYILDSAACSVYLVTALDTQYYYKLNAQEGESWEVWRSSQSSIIATVVREFDGLVIDTVVHIKQIEYSSNGLQLGSDYLGSSMGLIGTDIDGWPDGRVRGMIINGVQREIVTSVPEFRAGLADNFRLGQNYPNPFNPTTQIQFELPHASQVDLGVYNTLGQQVAALVSDKLPAGSHVTSFDAHLLPGGVYFCRMHSGRGVQTIKMLLLK